MNYLVIGLGSMGKRRIRNLIANGEKDIYGFDIRKDRIEESIEKYGIKTFSDFEEANLKIKFDAFIISVPPDLHMKYAHYAIDSDINMFIEASVTSENMEELIIKSEKKSNIKICPSATLLFHPAVKLIKKLITDNTVGKVSNFSYHSGQYLPDWHPWEDVNDFYVSNPVTGGCREIVPFEMAWLNDIFGEVESIKGFKDKTVDVGTDIDDTYTAVIKYKKGILGTLLVDIVARNAVRNIIINGSSGQILWDWNKSEVKLYDSIERRWIIYKDPAGKVEAGYNQNIIEEMYIEEIHEFISSIKGEKRFRNSLKKDYELLQLLYKMEESCDRNE